MPCARRTGIRRLLHAAAVLLLPDELRVGERQTQRRRRCGNLRQWNASEVVAERLDGGRHRRTGSLTDAAILAR